MFRRIYLNGNEDTAYPLVPNDIYPNSLITGIMMAIPSTIHNSYIYVSSVTVSEDSVSVLIFHKSAGAIGSATYDKNSEYPIVNILDPNENPVGWISFGSGVDSIGTYSGNVRIYNTCFISYPSSVVTRKLTVDDNTITMPDNLNFTTSDSVVYNSNTYTISLDKIPQSGSGYMKNSYSNVCPIISINGTPLETDEIFIVLPMLYSTEFDTFVIRKPKVSPYTAIDNALEIGVSTTLSNYIDESFSESFSDSTDTPEYSLIADTFGCGSTPKSVLLDTILPSSYYNTSYELPLDKVLDWYKTVVVDNKTYQE